MPNLKITTLILEPDEMPANTDGALGGVVFTRHGGQEPGGGGGGATERPPCCRTPGPEATLVIRDDLTREQIDRVCQEAMRRVCRFLHSGPGPDGWQQRPDSRWQTWLR